MMSQAQRETQYSEKLFTFIANLQKKLGNELNALNKPSALFVSDRLRLALEETIARLEGHLANLKNGGKLYKTANAAIYIEETFQDLLKTKRAAQDFLNTSKIDPSLSDQAAEVALELCLVTLSGYPKEKQAEVKGQLGWIDHFAKQKKWVALQDKVAAFSLNGTDPLDDKTLLDCATHIQNPTHLFALQASVLGEFCVTQNSAELKLKGLALLHHAAQSPGKGGDSAREQLRRIFLDAQGDIASFLKQIEAPYKIYQSHLEKEVPLDQCMSEITALHKKLEQFAEQKDSPQETLWIGEAADLEAKSSTQTHVRTTLAQLKQLHIEVQQAVPITNDPVSVQNYENSLKNLKEAAIDLPAQLDALLANTQANWCEEVPELKQQFEADLRQLSQQAKNLNAILNALLKHKLALPKKKKEKKTHQNSAKTAEQLMLNAIYHTQDDELVMKLYCPNYKEIQARGYSSIRHSETYPLGLLIAHAASAKRFSLLKRLIPELPKPSVSENSTNKRVKTLRQAEDTKALKQEGMSAIEIAAYEGQTEIVEDLLNAGASIDAALFWAFKREHTAVMKAILTHPTVDHAGWVCPRSGNTVLDYASLLAGEPDASWKFFLAIEEITARQKKHGDQFEQHAPLQRNRPQADAVLTALQSLRENHLQPAEKALLVDIMAQWVEGLKSPKKNEAAPSVSSRHDRYKLQSAVGEMDSALRYQSRTLEDLAWGLKSATKKQALQVDPHILYFISVHVQKQNRDLTKEKKEAFFHDLDAKLLFLISHWCESELNQSSDTVRWISVVGGIAALERALAKKNLPLEKLPLVQITLTKIASSCIVTLQSPEEALEEKQSDRATASPLSTQLADVSLYHRLLSRSPLTLAKAIQKNKLTVGLEHVRLAILLNGSLPKYKRESRSFWCYLDTTLLLLMSHWHENQLASGQGADTLEGIAALKAELAKADFTLEELPHVQKLLAEIESYSNDAAVPPPDSRFSKNALLLSPHKSVAEIEEAIESGELSVGVAEIELANLLHTGSGDWNGEKHAPLFYSTLLLLLTYWHEAQLNQSYDVHILERAIQETERLEDTLIDKAVINLTGGEIAQKLTEIHLSFFAAKRRLQEAPRRNADNEPDLFNIHSMPKAELIWRLQHCKIFEIPWLIEAYGGHLRGLVLPDIIGFIHTREEETAIDAWESHHYSRFDEFVLLMISEWHKDRVIKSSRWWENTESYIAIIMGEIERRGILLSKLPRVSTLLVEILKAANVAKQNAANGSDENNNDGRALDAADQAESKRDAHGTILQLSKLIQERDEVIQLILLGNGVPDQKIEKRLRSVEQKIAALGVVEQPQETNRSSAVNGDRGDNAWENRHAGGSLQRSATAAASRGFVGSQYASSTTSSSSSSSSTSSSSARNNVVYSDGEGYESADDDWSCSV